MADTEKEGAAEGEAAAPAPKSKFKLMVMIVGVLAVLGIGAATWFVFFRHPPEDMHAEEVKTKPPVFVEVPDMMVNLAGAPGERVPYLRVKVVLEVKEESQEEGIKPTSPRAADIFQTYRGERRPADLAGSAGLFRLKEELTRRVN